MFTAYVVVTIATVLLNAAAAVADFRKPAWILANMTSYGVPHAWLPWLGIAKAAGAVGLVVGFAIPALGVVTAVCLTLYFLGAVIFVARARVYPDLPYSGGLLVLSGATLAFQLATG
ncbi:DoxX family protein [Actinokineospora sp. HUAS TT18]|uniref:DoxX family protein n=1 Tax=Actinokineospora sp. HUAS TT18 TaxID=3447451 RepID=UPI003F52880C